VVFGIFNNRTDLERAVDVLKSKGFRNNDISALMPDTQSTKEFAHEKATKAPEGATTGVASGLALSGTLGWLVGAGALAIPGIGPFVAAGPDYGSSRWCRHGGTVGGLAGAMIGFGISEYEAKRYEGLVKEGGLLLSAHCDDSAWVDKAKEIFKDCGAHDIDFSTEEKVSGKTIPRNIRPDSNFEARI